MVTVSTQFLNDAGTWGPGRAPGPGHAARVINQLGTAAVIQVPAQLLAGLSSRSVCSTLTKPSRRKRCAGCHRCSRFGFAFDPARDSAINHDQMLAGRAIPEPGSGALSPASGLAPEAKPAPEPARDRQCCRIRLVPAMLGDVLDLLKLDPQPRGMQDGRVEHSPIRGRRDVSKGVGRSHPVRLIGRSHHAIGNWVRFAKSRLSLVACGSILCPIRLLKNASPRTRLAGRRAYLDLVLSPSSTRRRIASGRDGLSSCAAAQASIRERGPVNSLTPIKVPLPVVRGRPRFFVLSLIDFGAIWVNTKGIGPPRC